MLLFASNTHAFPFPAGNSPPATPSPTPVGFPAVGVYLQPGALSPHTGTPSSPSSPSSTASSPLITTGTTASEGWWSEGADHAQPVSPSPHADTPSSPSTASSSPLITTGTTVSEGWWSSSSEQPAAASPEVTVSYVFLPMDVDPWEWNKDLMELDSDEYRKSVPPPSPPPPYSFEPQAGVGYQYPQVAGGYAHQGAGYQHPTFEHQFLQHHGNQHYSQNPHPHHHYHHQHAGMDNANTQPLKTQPAFTSTSSSAFAYHDASAIQPNPALFPAAPSSGHPSAQTFHHAGAFQAYAG
ncbi:hypothetical protein HDU96_002533 [Phlyctochytrium bullatum]|nr:hypothetical protein HDU96_002533 [Phlyctochytrium bullatum]